MSTGTADTGVLNAHELLARSIASSGVVDHTTGAAAIGKQFQKFGKAMGGFAAIKQKQDEITKAKEQQEYLDAFNDKAKELTTTASNLPENAQNQLVQRLNDNISELGTLNPAIPEDATRIANIMTSLDEENLRLQNLAVFKTKFIESINTSEADGGLTNRWKSTNQALEYLGIIDGTTETQYIDGSYKFLISSEDKEKENYNKIDELTTQLNELDEQFEFGGITDDEEYFDKQLEINSQIEEIQADIDSGSKDWISYNDMQSVINENSFDKSINNTIEQIAKNSLEAGQGGESFESLPNLNDIVTNIINEGNLTSLTLDSHIKGLGENGKPRNFREDLYTSIFLGPDGSGTKWEDLGLDPDTINALDQDPGTGTDSDKTKISPEDALAITDAILDNKYLSTEYLADYIYNYFKQNWEKGNKEYTAEQEYDPIVGL